MVQCLPSMQKAPGMNPSIKNNSNRSKEMDSAKHKWIAQAIQEVSGGVVFFIPTLTSNPALEPGFPREDTRLKYSYKVVQIPFSEHT